MGAEIPNANWNFGGGGWLTVKYRDPLLCGAVQKGLNESRCRLEYGLGWAQVCIC